MEMAHGDGRWWSMFSLDPGSGRGAYGCVFMDNKAVGLIQLFKHGHTHNIYMYIKYTIPIPSECFMSS